MDGAAEPAEDRLYGLMEVAERQQAAVLARGVASLQSGTGAAARAAVAEGLAGAAVDGVAAVQAATGPLLSRLAGVSERAGQADAALRGVVAWASWRLLGWMVAAVARLVMLGWLAATLVL